MKAVWVNRFGPELASFRYRSLIPAQEVAKLGIETALNNGEADVVIFSKICEEDYPIAEKAKADGAKIIIDVSDDHFNDEQAATYRKFSEFADKLVVASEVMRNRVLEYTKKDAFIITDPYEQEECEPHAEGEDWLWFGHQRNFKELKDVVHLLNGRKIRVVTGPKEIPGTIKWSLEAMREVYKVSNLVLLPTSEGMEYKSPNRLVNSIRAGCFPVCMSHPAYTEFKKYVWVGHLPTGFKWVKAFQKDLNWMVKDAQDYVRDKYSPETIGKQWKELLTSL